MKKILIHKIFVLILFLSGFNLMAAPKIQDQIKSEIHQYFNEIYDVEDENLNINYRRFPECSSFENGNYEIDVYTQRRNQRLGYQTIWADLKQDSQLIIKFPISIDVSITRNVVVARKKIKRQSKITADMLAVEKRKISTDWYSHYSSIDQVLGNESKRVIANGSTMKKDMVRIPPVVHRGDQIKLQMMAGNLMITTTGIAAGEGAVGDLIRVKNASTGKKLKAQITSPGFAVVR